MYAWDHQLTLRAKEHCFIILIIGLVVTGEVTAVSTQSLRLQTDRSTSGHPTFFLSDCYFL